MLYIIRQILQPILAVIMSINMLVFPVTDDRIPEEMDQVQNVIYLIGDGMGPLHLEKAKQERNISLTMETMKYSGRSMTRSQFNLVTDSAAGATALSCGVRTINGYVGVFNTKRIIVENTDITVDCSYTA